MLPLIFVHHLYRDYKELNWVDIFPLKCDNRPNIYTYIYETNHGKHLVASQISHLERKEHSLSPWLTYFTVLSALPPWQPSHTFLENTCGLCSHTSGLPPAWVLFLMGVGSVQLICAWFRCLLMCFFNTLWHVHWDYGTSILELVLKVI